MLSSRRTPRRAKRCSLRSRAMLSDIDDVPIGAPNKKSTDTPWFVGNRVHDLIATLSHLFIGGINVIDLDSHDGVLWRRSVSAHNLDARARVSRGEPGHPALVHHVFGQAEDLKELPRPFDVFGVQVGDGLDRFHRPSLTPVRSAPACGEHSVRRKPILYRAAVPLRFGHRTR